MGLSGDAKREYQRQWLARKREKAIHEYGGVCSQCGSSEDLEFDHINPELKARNIGAIWSYSWENIRDELAKCQLLCVDCHKAKTRETSYKGHGCEHRYRDGCRCQPCKDAHAERARRYRAGPEGNET
jgi:5-methylcytosine-specific restriction endonuclease McrA